MRKLEVKIFSLDGGVLKRIALRPPACAKFTAKGVDMALMKLANQIEAKVPSVDYRLVQTGPLSFNFIPELKPES